MECVKTEACSIVDWLDFTMDLPQYHESEAVPILNLQVWVQHPSVEEEADGLVSLTLIVWKLFEKKTSSRMVLRAEIVYTWRSKIMTLSMDIFCRMRNNSRQLSLEMRFTIMNFVCKLRTSGHNWGSCRGILESGIKYYYGKVRIDLEGGPSLNQRMEHDTISSQKWFSRRR